MIKITLDAALREKLQGLSQAVELCDESGQVVARVLPTLGQILENSREPKISEEELDRREKEEGGMTTAEVLAYLEKL